MKKTIILITSLLFLPFPSFAIKTSSYTVAKADNSTCEITAENGETGEYSEQQLKTLASRITVRVRGDNNGGSGTLLGKQGNNYLVLTNSHVIRGVKNVSLQTSDGKTHPAQIVTNTNFEKFDLALLQFQTNQNYCLQEVANFLPNTDTQVMAAGYSAAKGEIVFRTGTVQQIWDRPLKEGYQIGYTSDIEQGMSGGVILNSVGQIIGVNGKSAYPILNTGYVYPDGSRPSDEEIQQMRQLSWGIPISTFLAQVKPDILTAYSLPVPIISDDLSQPNLTGWLGELEQKAKQITVRIDSSNNGNGSGVIIAKEGDIYTVLTAAHVFSKNEDDQKLCEECTYTITAPDGKRYPVDKSNIKLETGVDLAVVKFTSTVEYEVATLAKYNYNQDDYVLTAGYPRLRGKSPWRLTMGRIYDKESGLISVRSADYQNLQSSGLSQLKLPFSLTGGYELVYSSITFGGMSGGPVLDTQGRVIGIHGRAEGEVAIDEKKGDFGSSGGMVQLGNSLGIPVSTFLAMATRLNTQPQKVETTRPQELNQQKVDIIQSTILSVVVSKGNATASQWIERGNQLRRLRRYQEAVQAFDEAIKLQPVFIHLAYYGKGLSLYTLKKYPEAVLAMEQSVKSQPNFASAWRYLSWYYQEIKQLDKALGAINKAIRLQPKNSVMYGIKSILLVQLKKYAEAEIAINEAIKLTPLGIGYSVRAAIYIEQKKFNLALADLKQSITIHPQSVLAYLLRGSIYIVQQKFDLALTDLNQAIKIDPQLANAYALRASVFVVQQKFDLALSDSNKAIEIDHKIAIAYVNRGIVYANQKKWDLALSEYSQAIKINPDYDNAYYSRGILYYEQNKWELALADFNQAIKINPDFTEAYNSRGVIYYKQKKWDVALADFSNAIKINPQSAQAYGMRGVVYTLKGDKPKAIQDLQQAAQLFQAQGNTAGYEVVINLLKQLQK
ncbi:MAG TPA: tetratricopeptide repeat protein [Trichormus sp. M33_DOE_039]|nr:tetratricopeptide repeat protein [Trichormus sp. M33_DOE_039]